MNFACLYDMNVKKYFIKKAFSKISCILILFKNLLYIYINHFKRVRPSCKKEV